MLKQAFSRSEKKGCSRGETSIVQCHRGRLAAREWVRFCLVGVHVYEERKMGTVGLVEFITFPDS